MLDSPVSAVLECSGMTVRCAPPVLRKYLGCFWALNPGPAASIQTFPDGCAQLLVEIADAAQPLCVISGPRLTAGVYVPPSRKNVVGVRLRPGVAHALLQLPICGLVDARVVFAAPELECEMARADSTDARFDVLETFVEQRLIGAVIDERVDKAVHLIGASSGDARIEEVARECGLGRRQLERLMRVWVGVTPKRLSRIARFQAVLGGMAAQAPREWVHMAAATYADQPHMIREFSEFAGSTPRRLIMSRSPTAEEARCG
jgi:AraC-like DNA-binding protein